MDLLSLLGSALLFILSMVWSLVWFVLRDLFSTLLWLLIVAWLVLSVRYRSAAGGLFALARWGRFGLWALWRWMRGAPAVKSAPAAAPPAVKPRTKGRRTRRVPFGYMSVSEQLNVLLLIYIASMIYL